MDLIFSVDAHFAGNSYNQYRQRCKSIQNKDAFVERD